MKHALAMWAAAALLVAAGCGGREPVQKPENPTPPPPAGALQSTPGAEGPSATLQEVTAPN